MSSPPTVSVTSAGLPGDDVDVAYGGVRWDDRAGEDRQPHLSDVDDEAPGQVGLAEAAEVAEVVDVVEVAEVAEVADGNADKPVVSALHS